MWQTVWRKRRIIDSFYQRLSPEKLRTQSELSTMSLQIFQFSKFASACIFATFKFFQGYAEIYMVSIFLRNLCQIVSGEANFFFSAKPNPRLGFLLEIVGEWVMNPSKNEFALTYIPHRSWWYVCILALQTKIL